MLLQHPASHKWLTYLVMIHDYQAVSTIKGQHVPQRWTTRLELDNRDENDMYSTPAFWSHSGSTLRPPWSDQVWLRRLHSDQWFPYKDSFVELWILVWCMWMTVLLIRIKELVLIVLSTSSPKDLWMIWISHENSFVTLFLKASFFWGTVSLLKDRYDTYARVCTILSF